MAFKHARSRKVFLPPRQQPEALAPAPARLRAEWPEQFQTQPVAKAAAAAVAERQWLALPRYQELAEVLEAAHRRATAELRAALAAGPTFRIMAELIAPPKTPRIKPRRYLLLLPSRRPE